MPQRHRTFEEEVHVYLNVVFSFENSHKVHILGNSDRNKLTKLDKSFDFDKAGHPNLLWGV